MANFNISSASRNRDKKKKVDSSNPTLVQVSFSFDFGFFFLFFYNSSRNITNSILVITQLCKIHRLFQRPILALFFFFKCHLSKICLQSEIPPYKLGSLSVDTSQILYIIIGFQGTGRPHTTESELGAIKKTLLFISLILTHCRRRDTVISCSLK